MSSISTAVDGSNFPKTLADVFLDNFPKLTREQAGHLRHFHNLVSQKDGEWRHMGSQDTAHQEWLDALRYQLAIMAYATGAAHYHHLPLLRSAFKSLLEKIIHKMLLDDVWSYWFLTSHSGSKLDPDLKQLRQPWADPIVRENIMYSGHLLLMVSLYAMLFDDDKYNQKGALEFKWAPIFWGMGAGAEKFSYTRQTLQDAIINEMERENWLGVCCEPNSIFVVCNQFPLIALRYNDVREKTNVSSHVLERYLAAWKSKGMLHDHGLFVDRYCPAQDAKKPPKDVSFTAWALAFMNSWNPEFAYETSQKLHVGFLAKPTTRDHIVVTDPRIAIHIRRLAENEGKDPMDPSTFEEAAAIVDREPTEPRPYKKPEFGYAIQWISELGDRSTKDGMLSYADDTFNPTWVDGGLFYPTRPSETPHNYCTPFVDAVTGNAAIGYGRLNVQGGQRQMYANPWTDDHFENYPFVTNVDLSSGVDFLRGSWDDELHALCITMRSWNGKSKAVQPHLSGLKTGSYGLYVNGELSDVYEVPVSGSTIELNLSVSGEELDIVLLERV